MWDVVPYHEGAVEDDVVACVLLWVAEVLAVGVKAWGVCARACGDIIGSRAELVGVICIEAVGDGKAKDGEGDESAV